MYRYIIIVLTFILQLNFAYGAQTSTCVVQKESTVSNSVRDICSATLIDQHNVLFDPSCQGGVNPRSRRNQRYIVSCANGLTTFKLPKINTFRPKRSSTLFTFEDELPFIPTKHSNQVDNSTLANCFIETHKRQIPLRSNRLKEDTRNLNFQKDLSNAPVYCKNTNDDEVVLMGTLDENGHFKDIDSLSNEFSIDSDFKVNLDTSNYEQDSISEICHGAYQCVSELIEDVNQLNKDLDEILKRFSNKQIEEERQQLARDFQELEAKCHRTNVEARIDYNTGNDAGMGDKAMGALEKGVIGVFRAIESVNPFDDEDFLLSQFKNTEAIAQNLSEAEIKATFEKVNQLDLSNFEKIRELALAYSETVVHKVLDEMGTFETAQEKNDFLKLYMDDFKVCLSKTINSSQVKECANTFTNNISTAIGEVELDRQIGLNFSPEDDLSSLKLKAKNKYLGCLDKNLGKFEKIIDTTATVKGCVYQGMIASYQETRRTRLNDTLKSYTGRDDNREIVTSILSKTNTCRFAPVINKADHNDRDYLALAQMSTDSFTNEIKDCIDGLQRVAAGDVVEIAVRTNQQIVENLSADEAQLLSQELKDIHLRACMEARKTSDGNECAKFVTAMATLTAAESILRNEFESQFEDLNLPQQRRDELTDEIIEQYQACAQRTKEEYYKDLTKEPNEKLVNNCLTGAIKKLSSSILEDSINKATAEKDIDVSLVSRAVDRQKLERLKTEIKKCFDEGLGKYETMSTYQENLNKEIENCTFKTQKTVIESIAQEMASDKIGDFGLSENKTNEVRQLISSHINASTPLDMDERIDTLTPLLIRNVASEAIEGTVSDFKSTMTKEEYETKRDQIQDQLNTCLDKVMSENEKDTSFNATDASNICISVTAKDAFITLAPTIIEESIAPLFNSDLQKVLDLTNRAKRNVMPCLARIKDDENAQANAEKCVIDELPQIATTIASQLLGDLNSFANKDGRQPSLLASNSYQEFEKCLIRLESPSLSEATENMNDCIKDLERGAKTELQKRFVHVYGQNNPREINEVIDLILQIPGEDKAQEYKSNEETSGTPNSELISTLELLGETMKYSCDNNTAVCQQHIYNAKISLTRHFQNNPNATTQENTQAFMNSPIMDNVIASQIGMTLNETFKTELNEYNDSSNLLNRKIDEITNNRMLTDILATPEGRQLKSYIFDKIEKGELDNLAEDTRLRELLAEALTKDTGEGSFGDGLAEGLVQIQLNKMRRRSSGFGGLFREFKVKFGDILNIIDRKDFKWDILTKTRSGQRAREYMIKEILAPSIKGEDLSALESRDRKYPNQQEERLGKLTEMITQALKEAND